ncbi:MAG: precorrin-2 C(20)-methyltransferase [Alphaproteobacteria bacterium]|nr:precorrin-2 C(20)-methyltransferase [Alphaproteobacteria bacterium]MCY4318890.1 precorrin-2 C(20)-methyltransferase [Alphaproteobacteria bacterium]
MSGWVCGVGVGPGDPELLTLKGLRIIRQADVLAFPAPLEGESFARAIVASHLDGSQIELPIRMPMQASRFPAKAVYDQAAQEIAAHLKAAQGVAVLCQGDPFLYGSFLYLFARLSADWPVEVVPGISSLTACAAAAGAALAARNDALSVLPAPLGDAELEARLSTCDAAVFVKVGRHFPRVRSLLMRLGLGDCARLVVHAGLPDERILPLHAVDPINMPYFSTILLHKRGEAWL